MIIESRTICIICADKIEGAREVFDAADHRVLGGFGPDSLCDFCGKENGGAIISVGFATSHEKHFYKGKAQAEEEG